MRLCNSGAFAADSPDDNGCFVVITVKTNRCISDVVSNNHIQILGRQLGASVLDDVLRFSGESYGKGATLEVRNRLQDIWVLYQTAAS